LGIFKTLIIKEWLKAFIGAASVLFIMVTVSNLIDGFLRSSVTPWEVVINYFLDMPKWINRLLPVSSLVASLFSINKLLRRNELIALFSSGFSRKKFIITILQVSSIVAGLQFLNTSFAEPFSKKLRYYLVPQTVTKFKHDRNLGLRTSALDSGKIWYKSKNYFFSFSTFDKANNAVHDVNLYYFSPDHKLQTLIIAKKAIFIEREGWKFYEGEKTLALNTVNFPRNVKFQEELVVLNEVAQDFKDMEADINTLSIFSLAKFIYKINKSGTSSIEYEILFLKKFADSILTILFSMVAISIIFNPNRRSASFLKTVSFTFVFSILFFLVDSSFLALGNSGKISVFMATFFIPFIFSLYIIFRIRKNRQLA
jgi:lipopolysaccharide export system permease protein